MTRYGRKGRSLRDTVLRLHQSGCMASSVVVFGTEVADLSENLSDLVDVLYGIQLGGTDIKRALASCQGVIQRPEQTILVLISDLYESGNEREMRARAHARALKDSGVNVIALLALSDDGAPGCDHSVLWAFAGVGIPAFACTPDHFSGLMAVAMRDDVAAWARKERGAS